MSKRGAENQGGEERYGSGLDQGGPDGVADKPRTATAAQMATRKSVYPLVLCCDVNVVWRRWENARAILETGTGFLGLEMRRWNGSSWI